MDAETSAARLDHLGPLAALSARFCDHIAGTNTDAPVPSCPGWTVQDLALHLGTVWDRAGMAVRTGERPARAGPCDGEALADFVVRTRAALIAALMETDPHRSCWTFHPDEATVRFWHRRQMHETLVHLWDLRAATETGTDLLADVDPAICADGVDEVLWLAARRPLRQGAERTPLGGTMALAATDTGDRWLVGDDWQLIEPVTGGDAEVVGAAGPLLLSCWRRPIPADSVVRTGEAGIHEVFRTAPVVA